MQRFILPLMVLVSFVLAVFTPVAVTAQVGVFVSIPPQKFLVERIGGDRVRVNSMVRAGARPETYEPTPKQMAALQSASIYFRIGVPFEDVWIDKIRDQNPVLQIVDCCEAIRSGLSLTQGYEEHSDDRHVWTSPVVAIDLSRQIRDTLIKQDPAQREFYSRNYASLEQDLQDLDAFIRARLENLRHRYIIVSHPSWGYYADTYKLEQIAIEQHGSEVSARKLAELVELARSRNIKTVFIQKQFNTASAKTLAREIGARLVELDPLAQDYIDNLRYVTRMIAQEAGQK